MADLSSGRWIRLKADSILRLTRVPAARYKLQLILSCGWLEFYTLIYQVNLRTYSAKCIIFMVCFLPTDFSYHWSRIWLLLQEPWRSLKKLEEAWRSFMTLAATDSSCSGWFETCEQWTTSRILTPMPPDRFWTPEPECWALDTGLWTLDATLWTLGSGHWKLSWTVSKQNQNTVSDSAWLNFWKFFLVRISIGLMITLFL